MPMHSNNCYVMLCYVITQHREIPVKLSSIKQRNLIEDAMTFYNRIIYLRKDVGHN